MGALDDAIREHLELKRRHGASEEEIQQAEAEALGPARRSIASEPLIDEAGMPAPAAAFEDAPPAPGEAVADAPPPPPDLEPHADAPEDPEPYEPEPEPGETQAPTPAPLDPAAITAAVEPAPVEPAPVELPPVESAPVEPPPVESVEPGESHQPPDGDDPDRTRTAILDDPLREPPPVIHDEPGPDDPPAPARPMDDATRIRETPPPPDDPQDDVLEETPDFLQETPEHDRLWFEQKPPRDFDFDD
jgi:hypothetical protein